MSGLLSFLKEVGQKQGRAGVAVSWSLGTQASLISRLCLLTSTLPHVLRCLLGRSSLLVQIPHSREEEWIGKLKNSHPALHPP